MPCVLSDTPLSADNDGKLNNGLSIPDAPLKGNGWLIHPLQGEAVLMGIGDIAIPDISGLKRIGINQKHDDYSCYEADGETLVSRYGSEVIYLIRPDGHIAASFNTADAEKINAAYQKMLGKGN